MNNKSANKERIVWASTLTELETRNYVILDAQRLADALHHCHWGPSFAVPNVLEEIDVIIKCEQKNNERLKDYQTR